MLTCIFEDGGKASLRHAVADVMIIDKDNILLVKRAPHLSNPNKWGLIGGYVDRDEWVEQTAKREALEESGYEIELGELFRIVDNPDRRGENRQNIAFIFIAKPIRKVAESDKEASEVRWFSLDNLPKQETFAFDHYEQVELYLRHLKEPFSLPIVGKI